MGEPANYNWRRSRQKDLQQKVGRLYERMMKSALSCELSPRGHPELADLFSVDLGIRVDVKARGDNNSLDLRVSQIDEYGEEAPFPIEHTLYALVPYKSSLSLNKQSIRPRGISKKTKMLSLLRSIRGDHNLNLFLSANVNLVYLLDIRIINALRRNLGHTVNRLAGRPGQETVSITRTKLIDLFGDSEFEKSLRSLKLDPRGWAKGVYPLRTMFEHEGHSYSSNFTLVSVVRKRLHANLAKMFANKAITLE